MTEKQYNRKKISAIMQLETFQRVQEWWIRKHKGIPAHAVPPFEGCVYKKTNDRQYLSKWLERFIILFIKREHPSWEVHKVDNKGTMITETAKIRRPNGQIHERVIDRRWVKNKNIRKGEPDIRCLVPGVGSVWFEVKIGNDRLSDNQKDFIAKKYGPVYVVKTVEDVREAYRDIMRRTKF